MSACPQLNEQSNKKDLVKRMHRRDLTAGEGAILRVIQQGYGSQNVAEGVFFTEADEAIISAKKCRWHIAGDGEPYQPCEAARGWHDYQRRRIEETLAKALLFKILVM
jgi:hypothetical protein